MFQLTGVPVLWDVVPLYSDSDMTADNAYRNLDATIHSQHGIVCNESNLQISRHLSAILHISLLLLILITSLSPNPIIVLVILHVKLCCAILV
jgi:hypothetical protein